MCVKICVGQGIKPINLLTHILFLSLNKFSPTVQKNGFWIWIQHYIIDHLVKILSCWLVDFLNFTTTTYYYFTYYIERIFMIYFHECRGIFFSVYYYKFFWQWSQTRGNEYLMDILNMSFEITSLTKTLFTVVTIVTDFFVMACLVDV